MEMEMTFSVCESFYFLSYGEFTFEEFFLLVNFLNSRFPINLNICTG